MTGATCKCGTLAELRRGTTDLCASCWQEILEGFSASAWNPLHGFGVQCGPVAPEFGEGFMHLRCSSVRCGALWVGRAGEACGYCQTRHRVGGSDEEIAGAERAIRDHFLSPPARYPGESRPDYAHRVNAWGKSMHRAVLANLVDKSDALAAWRSAVNRLV